MNQRVLDDKQAAAKLNVKTQTLRNWRHLGKGPAYLRVGERAIRYLESDLEAFLTGNRITSRAA